MSLPRSLPGGNSTCKRACRDGGGGCTEIKGGTTESLHDVIVPEHSYLRSLTPMAPLKLPGQALLSPFWGKNGHTTLFPLEKRPGVPFFLQENRKYGLVPPKNGSGQINAWSQEIFKNCAGVSRLGTFGDTHSPHRPPVRLVHDYYSVENSELCYWLGRLQMMMIGWLAENRTAAGGFLRYNCC